jgi:sterol desaturase/sphingolipid hydroxylase (fatty acid hydroxylase superfamily)
MAHPFRVRSVIATDLAVMLFISFTLGPASHQLSNRIGVGLPVPHGIDALPLGLRVVCYLIVADFGHYWMHRLMHTKYLWRIHKWHHAPTHMSWTAGVRATFFDSGLVNLAYVFAWPLLGTTSDGLEVLLAFFVLFKNDWMHLNVRWQFPRLEALIVTPAYHHIHHSVDPAHYQKNLGALLSVWDRLFGTQCRPSETSRHLEFGIGEQVPTLQLIAGL